jgi:hypothetical protein
VQWGVLAIHNNTKGVSSFSWHDLSFFLESCEYWLSVDGQQGNASNALMHYERELYRKTYIGILSRFSEWDARYQETSQVLWAGNDLHLSYWNIYQNLNSTLTMVTMQDEVSVKITTFCHVHEDVVFWMHPHWRKLGSWGLNVLCHVQQFICSIKCSCPESWWYWCCFECE